MANHTIYPYGVGGELPEGYPIVNDLVTGGADKALSAEQGKVLKEVIESVHDALANLAFTDTKPTLPWPKSQGQYVQDGLVLHLDGINKGDVPDQWTDLINGVAFPNHGAIELENGWELDGYGWLGINSSDASLQYLGASCTIEVCFEDTVMNQSAGSHSAGMFLVGLGASPNQGTNLTNALYVNTVYANNGTKYINGVYIGNTTNVWEDPLIDIVAKNTLSLNKSVAVHNGQTLESLGTNHWASVKGGRTIGVQWHSNGTLTEYARGKIFSIRVYDRILTENEMLQNQRVDNERFNLGLTLPEPQEEEEIENATGR